MRALFHDHSLIAILVFALPLTGCRPETPAGESFQPAEAHSQDWPAGTLEEQIEEVAAHIGGFSPAMREVGYRYNELYFAGADENWLLAEYHATKIADAIEQGIERRPARARSAQPFLSRDLPALIETIGGRDRPQFLEQDERLTHACNICHLREDVPFVAIRQPERRVYPWYTP